MLLRFSCENAFCFLNETTLDMVASNDKRHADHVRESPRASGPAVLRAAGIYGANGHGKTRFIDAVLFLKQFACGNSSDALRDFSHFKLKKGAAKLPSRFVVNFRTPEADFEYGLVVLEKEVEQEWLYEKSTRQEAMLFTRERVSRDSDKEMYSLNFGPRLKNSKSPSAKLSMEAYLDAIGVGISATDCFLHEAVQKKVIRLKRCADWFRLNLHVVKADSIYNNLHSRASRDDNFLKEISNYLCRMDTGIGNLIIKKTIAHEDALETIAIAQDPNVLNSMKDLTEDTELTIRSPDGAQFVVQKENGNFAILEFKTVHKTDDGEVDFDITDESSGTRRLMDLYPMMHNKSVREQVYFVDELDRKLHPLAAYDLVESFLRNNRGQLIYTTHTTHMLDLELLRRDEVWLVQKKPDGSSEMYSLADFKIRPDVDIRKGYLQGRFGGIPFVGSTEALGWN